MWQTAGAEGENVVKKPRPKSKVQEGVDVEQMARTHQVKSYGVFNKKCVACAHAQFVLH